MLQFNDKFSTNAVSDLRKQAEEDLVKSLAPQQGLEYINLQGYTINPEALVAIPEARAREARLVAFDRTHDTLLIALQSPHDQKTIDLINTIQNQRLIPKLYLCSTNSLEHAWKRYQDILNTTAKKKGVFDFSPEDIIRFASNITKKEDVRTIMATIGTINNARRITETLELIFAGALGLKASDIHIEPEETTIRIRYRLDGVLHDVFDIDRYIYERVMSRLKLLAGMTLNKKQEAQDGRFTFELGEREIEIRTSVIPGASGESVVMRLLDPSVAGFSMDKLKLNPALHQIMTEELKRPNGLIITTGPTGSGKTTALYAFLREVHKEGTKIITIENPVEYKIDGIVQTQTGEDYTFASGLRAILRQDPDVIMVGEIRDRDVAETAIHAAQTGHLVFSTLHTNSAVGGFPRLIDLGVDSRMIGSSINIILGQRLVRVLCQNCKKGHQATAEETALINHVMSTHPTPSPLPSPLTLFSAGGCTDCGGTGYKGRIGIFEAIIVDEAVEEVVIRDPREHVILEAAKPQGIPSMLHDGVVKVLHGDTSLEELERVIELPRRQILSATTPPAASNDDFLSHIVT